MKYLFPKMKGQNEIKKYNMEHYFVAQKSYTQYKEQILEVDAEKFAKQKVNEFYAKYQTR